MAFDGELAKVRAMKSVNTMVGTGLTMEAIEVPINIRARAFVCWVSRKILILFRFSTIQLKKGETILRAADDETEKLRCCPGRLRVDERNGLAQVSGALCVAWRGRIARDRLFARESPQLSDWLRGYVRRRYGALSSPIVADCVDDAWQARRRRSGPGSGSLLSDAGRALCS